MSPMNQLLGLSKRTTAILGAAVAVCGAYVAVGLPIPATEASVTARLQPFSVVLTSVQTTQKQIVVDLSAVQRNQLRNERFTLERSMKTASPADRIAFQLRIGQIDDEIVRLTKREEDAR